MASLPSKFSPGLARHPDAVLGKERGDFIGLKAVVAQAAITVFQSPDGLDVLNSLNTGGNVGRFAHRLLLASVTCRLQRKIAIRDKSIGRPDARHSHFPSKSGWAATPVRKLISAGNASETEAQASAERRSPDPAHAAARIDIDFRRREHYRVSICIASVFRAFRLATNSANPKQPASG